MSEVNEKEVGAPSQANEEYSTLIEFIRSQKGHSGEEEAIDDTHIEKRRNWMMPWKVTEVRVNKMGEIEEVAAKVPSSWLETEMTRGISEAEVLKRRQMFGFNELESPSENLILKFFGFFKGPILYVMELAVLLAAGLREWIDFGVIIGILMLNAFVGWYQEKQAGDIVAQLKAGIALRSVVVRDGQEHEIEARDLVPGDIVIVEDGKTIPCDGRLLAEYEDKDGSKAAAIREKAEASKRAHSADDDDDEGIDKGPAIIACDQSAITGESLAVDKHIGDTVFYTTGCKRGKAYVLVTDIAKQTFVGRTAALVLGGAGTKGHFQIVMDTIGAALLILVMVFVLMFWISGFFRHTGIATPQGDNLLNYTLIFLVVGVPVGLPCVTTTTMAVGAAYLAKRQAIVQKLTAIESLAGVDVLCSDKTGTLTANKLSIHEPFTSEGVDVNYMMAVAALASSHNVKSLDPIDKVTISTLKDYPAAIEELGTGWTTHKFTPFDPVSKRITAEVEKDGKQYTAAKGAPNAILKLCNPDKATADQYRKVAGDFASRGFRSLGVAINDGQWKLLGLLPMFDPPRSDTAATIAEAQSLGVSVKMLTGDAVAIAKETCKMLALGTKVYDSQRLIGSGGMTGSAIHDFVEAADGFAEVFPEHKYQVVEMLQHRGHLTAMTGDGVNDAPSLKKADCGIAVEGASDAARSAADVVFLDEGLSTIITSIKVARQIFHRMKAYIQYRISLCLHLEVYLVLSLIIINETIRVELIVFIALFADLATIAIAYDNAPHARAPVEWQLPKIWIISTVLGLLLAAGTWILRGTLFLHNGGVIANFGNTQEILFLEVSLTENWLIFVTRLGGGESDITLPSWQLVGAVLAVDAIATLFCLFGWLSGAPHRNPITAPHGGWTDIVTVVRVWAYSLGVSIVLALVYYVMSRWSWLDKIGRRKVGVKNELLEDFFTNLQRLTIVHEKDADGGDLYAFQARLDVEDD